MSRCLPTDATRSIVRPVSGASACTRVSAGSTESKATTRAPASAVSSVLAARKIVSPSGMSAHLESHRRRAEASALEERRQRMLVSRDAIDLADEEAAAAFLGPGQIGEARGQRAACRRSRGLVVGEEHEELPAAAADVRGERAI